MIQASDIPRPATGDVPVCADAEPVIGLVAPVRKIVAGFVSRFCPVRDFIVPEPRSCEFGKGGVVQVRHEIVVWNCPLTGGDLLGKGRARLDGKGVQADVVRFGVEGSPQVILPHFQGLPRQAVDQVKVHRDRSRCLQCRNRPDCRVCIVGAPETFQRRIVKALDPQAYPAHTEVHP